jgi:hypothetical protein
MELVGMRAEPDGKPRPKGRTSDCADEVTLSLKGANSPTRGRKLRSTGTKATARVSNGPNSLVELKKQLEVRTRELAEARGHLSEALEQQTAASEVLRVISGSPSELAPVFHAMLANATRLCEANFGTLNLHDNGSFPVAATHNVPGAYAEYRRRHPLFNVGPNHPLARVAATKQVLHIADMRAEASTSKKTRRLLRWEISPALERFSSCQC